MSKAARSVFVFGVYAARAILLFGGLDVLTALWTVAALRADARAGG